MIELPGPVSVVSGAESCVLLSGPCGVSASCPPRRWAQTGVVREIGDRAIERLHLAVALTHEPQVQPLRVAVDVREIKARVGRGGGKVSPCLLRELQARRAADVAEHELDVVVRVEREKETARLILARRDERPTDARAHRIAAAVIEPQRERVVLRVDVGVNIAVGRRDCQLAARRIERQTASVGRD